MIIDVIKHLLENPIFTKYGILGLFFNSVISGIIPFPSEITTSALILAGQDLMLIFSVLSVGGIIGGIVLYIISYDSNKIFSILRKTHKKEHYEKSHILLNKYGWGIIAVSSWIPFLAEAIIIVSGVKKYNFKKFLISSAVGKTTHAWAIVYFSNIIFEYLRYLRF